MAFLKTLDRELGKIWVHDFAVNFSRKLLQYAIFSAILYNEMITLYKY